MNSLLYVTDGSVDSALTLRNWLTAHTQPAPRLTVVLPYDLAPDQPLHKDVLRPAKAAAEGHLQQWVAMLGDAKLGNLTTETLLASPEHATTLHLLIRPYDGWLVDDQDLMEMMADVLARTRTQPLWLTTSNATAPIARPILPG
ncbi:hypothetical protein FAES_4878 [Fibrella aestuarina BUZ 2]|uniref:UspA domain-containing protein n=1 Tax=Fibrella aestuarina BUZ 2 TaxID=1166018 RepID=I0KFH4_9BACT|nr:hypothetical protein [Fibrella aestuarina]CCH02877.1 hypothetical protein FAES_4878 [Fibrella aestuarina BUZ 2]